MWPAGAGIDLIQRDSADVYGKRKNILVAPQILSNNWDGYAVSYVDRAYGSDIMSVDDSFGGGGIGLFETPGSDLPDSQKSIAMHTTPLGMPSPSTHV